MKIAIGIIGYVSNDLHQEFLDKTIQSIHSDEHEVGVIIYPNKYDHKAWDTTSSKSWNEYNGAYPIFCPHDLRPENPVSVAESWNNLTDIAFGGLSHSTDYLPADYLIIANSDILFHPKAIDNLVKFAEEHKEFIMWTSAIHPNLRTLKNAKTGNDIGEHPHFSCFMINKDYIDKVGGFDSGFQAAYLEDASAHFKILRLGYKAGITTSSLFYHAGSRTIECDPELKKKNMVTHQLNREYFKRKHGFDVDGVGFSPPEKMLEVGYPYPFNNETKDWKDY